MFYTLLDALQETLFMVFSASFLTLFLGLPLGLLLTMTNSKHHTVFNTFNALMRFFGSMPYVILIIAIIPMKRFLMSNTLGLLEQSLFTIFILTSITLPFFIGLITQAFLQVPKGLIENAQAMGASSLQIIQKILIPEALSNIIKSITHMLVHLIGLSTLVGILGYGGLGQLAMDKGYHSFEIQYLLTSVILLTSLVYIIQRSGHYLAHDTLRRNL